MNSLRTMGRVGRRPREISDFPQRGLQILIVPGAPDPELNPGTRWWMPRRNLVLHSADFSNAVWGPLGFASTTVEGAETSPYPGGSVWRATEDTSAGFHRYFQSVSVVSGQAYTFSVTAKAGSRTHITLIAGTAGL